MLYSLTRISHRTLLACLLVAATLVAVAGPVDEVQAQAPWTDTSERAAVIAGFEAEFNASVPAIGWTGSRAGCVPGTTSQAYRNAIFSRVNWFRGMAGVPVGVTENTGYSSQAQQAALMMSETRTLSHYPDSSFSCYTGAGATAARSSNLYLGRTGPDAITGYVLDPGAGNTKVGHRNWILHPTIRQMGTGDIPAAGGYASNVLWVFDDFTFAAQPQLRESEGFVAWPPRGYVPGEVVFDRWSFSIRDADFRSAAVSMHRVAANGQLTAVSSNVVHRDHNGGAPFSLIVWEPTGINTSPAIDETYRVTVSGVGSGGATRSYSYDVTVIGDQAAVTTSVDYSGYVTKSFNDFLGRNPTSAELAEWSVKLNSGTDRFSFVLALAESEEWTAYVVDRMYLDTLGRASDAGGRAYWTNQLRGGMSVAQVAAQFYGSPEYIANEGNSHEAWLRDLYDELLYRNPDSAGLNYWLGQAQVTGSSAVAFTFYQSQESRMARVNDLFQKLLGRAPDGAGQSYWASVLLSGDDISLAASLAASEEYLISD